MDLGPPHIRFYQNTSSPIVRKAKELIPEETQFYKRNASLADYAPNIEITQSSKLKMFD